MNDLATTIIYADVATMVTTAITAQLKDGVAKHLKQAKAWFARNKLHLSTHKTETITFEMDQWMESKAW